MKTHFRTQPLPRLVHLPTRDGRMRVSRSVEHTGFAWDKVWILAPHTPDDKVDSVTGIEGAK